MQQQQKTCVLLGFAPLLFKALKKSNCIFFHKTEVALSLIDSILDPQASYPPPTPNPYSFTTMVALGAFTNN